MQNQYQKQTEIKQPLRKSEKWMKKTNMLLMKICQVYRSSNLEVYLLTKIILTKIRIRDFKILSKDWFNIFDLTSIFN